MRLETIANNIANAHSTRTPEGGPFRRQQVVFAALMVQAGAASDSRGGGVRVVGVEADSSPLPRLYQPEHPHADQDGFVTYPNVKLPNEMVDLITASRAYESNLRALRTFRRMVENTLSLLRGPS